MAHEENRHRRPEPLSRHARLRAALRTPAALRQAIVLAEVLAPPVAMRPSRTSLLRPISPPVRSPRQAS
jgi:hypothetical protein